MAQGRFVSTTIANDNQLARLSAEAEMMYLKCIPHLDRDGMITGDPIQLLTIISPLRFSQMAPSMATIVDEWAAVGLALRFPTPAGMALFFKGFLKNQTLRYDRERPSLYPPPPGYIHTANGLRPATDVPWVDSSIDGTPGSYPKNPAESPVLPESAPQAEAEAESAAPKQKSTDKQQQAEAAAAGPFSECRRLLVDFGVSEPSLTRILGKRHPPDHVRGWLAEAIQASQRKRKPLADPVAFVVARLMSEDSPPRMIGAAEWAEMYADEDEDPDSYQALKRRYIPQGWEDVIVH